MRPDTYQNILHVARRLFIKQGYTATSIRQIALEAGIGKATIYHHFPDKEAIALALLNQDVAGRKEALAVIRAEEDPRRRIEKAVKASLASIIETADIFQIVRREVPGGQAKFQTEFGRFMDEYVALLTESIQIGIDQGSFRRIDPRQAAHVLLTMIQGSFARRHLVGEQLQLMASDSGPLLDIFFHGIEEI